MKYLSLFSGIGGFELGIEQASRDRLLGNGQQPTKAANIRQEQDSTDSTSELGNGGWQCAECIGYSEIDKYAIEIYERRFNESSDEYAHISEKPKQEERTQGGQRSTDKQGLQLHDRNRTTPLCNRNKGVRNYGNATEINARELPDFDLLVGGFPCQAFSIAGKRAGFNDTRGTLFFDIARILKEKRPRHLVLENVKGLLSHEQGKTFQTILGVLADLGYFVEWQVLNSKDFGVPQNRERVFIVGHLGGEPRRKVFPIRNSHKPATEHIQRHTANTLTARYEAAQATGSYIIESELNAQKVKSAATRTRAYAGKPEALEVRDDNVSNTINSVTKDYYATDMTRIRRLTPLECERLQGFPDNWTEGLSDTQRYKTLGNAVTVNVVEAVITNLLESIDEELWTD